MRTVLRQRKVIMISCLGICLVLLGVTTAYGDGGFLPPADYSGKDLSEPCQRAVLVHDGRAEKLFLFVDYQGDVQHFAWIIPCPAMPEVSMTSEAVLKEAAQYYHHLELRDWKEEMARRRESEGVSGGGGPPSPDAVTLHSVRVVGPYEIATLSASQENVLPDWLRKNGYSVPTRLGPILEEYVSNKWFFVAVKIQIEPKDVQTLPPLRVTFRTEVPVYPLRISALGSGVTDVRVYLFRSVSGKPRQNRELGVYALDKDFKTLCPSLAREMQEIDPLNVEVSRIVDTLVPQVMSRLDDRLHGQSFYPYFCIAKTVGIAESLMSANKEESQWAASNLHYYRSEFLRRKPSKEHVDALRITGKRLGKPLRDKLLENIEIQVQQARERALYIKRDDWSQYLGLNNGASLEGSVGLLASTCERDDPQVFATLESIATVAGGGSYWGNALMRLNTPASRQAMFRIAESKSDLSAMFRFVYSLEDNIIDSEERRVVVPKLLTLLSKGNAVGDARKIVMKLLRCYTAQDFGEDWKQWEDWVRQTADGVKK